MSTAPWLMPLLLVLVAGVAFALIRSRRSRNATVALAAGLRERALSAPLASGTSGPLWGVVADVSLSGGTASIAAFRDGSVSLYAIPGRSLLGMGGNPAVREAADTLLWHVQAALPALRPAAAPPPLPPSGTIRFSAVTPSGLRLSPVVAHSEIEKPAHQFHASFVALNRVMSSLQAAAPPGA